MNITDVNVNAGRWRLSRAVASRMRPRAASGTVTYAVAGWGDPGRPLGSLGYIHMVAAVPILVA